MKCIEPVTFAMYSEEMLSSEEREQVEKHFAECDECREDYEFANAFLKMSEFPEWEPLTEDETRSVWEKIKKNITSVRKWVTVSLSELVQQPWFLSFEPLARGKSEIPPSHTDIIHLPVNIRDLEAEIYLTREKEDKVLLKVRIPGNGSDRGIFRITLTDDRGGIVASRFLKDDLVTFENLDFDAYNLAFYGHDDQWNYGFEINETGIDER